MTADEPPDGATPPICERCWGVIQPGQTVYRLGQIHHANLRGDVEWSYIYLHVYGDPVCPDPREEAA